MLVFAESVRRNPFATNTTDEEVIATIKAWLQFAADRNGGRQKRAVLAAARLQQ
jgi:hypothetical protein